jgi:hypothetical protein
MEPTMCELDRVAPRVMDIVRALASDACQHGAIATVLTGSFARGDAHVESDIDLHFVGDGVAYELSRTGGYLVSASWNTERDHRASFHDPSLAGASVPGWRGALIVQDQRGVAASLRQEARDWTWDAIGDATLNAWVADQLTGYAEEVHKLVIAIERQHATTAAVQRSILALRLARVMSVHLRLLYDTENRLWELVSTAMGEAWSSAQSRALGVSSETFAITCASALDLYLLATDAAGDVATPQQREVINHARQLAASVARRWRSAS